MKKLLVIKFILIAFGLTAQNVGIGTNNPSHKLHVIGGTNLLPGLRVGPGTLRIDSLASTSNQIIIANTDGDLIALPDGTAGQVLSTDGSGNFSWAVDGAGTPQTLSLSGSNLSIANGNSVSLASLSSSPQTLSLSGTNLTISSGNVVSLASLTSVWNDLGGNTYEIPTTSSHPYIEANLAGDPDGNAFGGLSSIGYVFFGVRQGNGGNEEEGMFANGNNLVFISPADNGNGNGNNIVEFWEEDSHTLRAEIDANGQYFQVSDANLKENIVPLDGSLNKIMQLNGYTYTYKQSPEDIEKGTEVVNGTGVLAQELASVFPTLAEKSAQGHYLVNYAGLVPNLIEAIKEQQKQIEELKALISK